MARMLDYVSITNFRAMARDLRSHLLKSIPANVLDNAIWQALDREEELLELIILRVRNRPDCQLLI